MQIAVCGGTGFVGRYLIELLLNKGHLVVLISRSKGTGQSHEIERLTWDEIETDPHVLDGVQAVVNLAGETINHRWTRSAKSKILQSRLDTTDRIVRAINKLERKPGVLVNGSGMSIYGVSETDTFDESSPDRVVDFLSGVVSEWERAADSLQNVRLVKLRVGLVLGGDGGALSLMALPYKLGIGGPVGSGRQWLSWIHVADIARLILFSIEEESVFGPLNAVGPAPVTNNEFGRTLGKVLKRPHWAPAPGAVLKLALGEMSDLILKGQRVLPAKALSHGFVFEYPTLESALTSIYK
jgi:uncharacterized protein (TIGR01777 family)